jgi:hypothetical protein
MEPSMTTGGDWLDMPGLDYESKVEMVATLILLREGSPRAGELLAPPPTDAARELRRAFLRETVEWLSAERMLAEGHLLV